MFGGLKDPSAIRGLKSRCNLNRFAPLVQAPPLSVASQPHRLLQRSQDSHRESLDGVLSQVIRYQCWTPVTVDPKQRIEKFFATLPRMEDDPVQQEGRSIGTSSYQ